MNFKGICVVESPYSGAAAKNPDIAMALITRNIAYAKAAMKWCLDQGYAPFASHLLYTQEGILDDTVPEERTKGMEAGFLIADKCASISIFFTDLGWSRGMLEGKTRAVRAGREVLEVKLFS